MVLSYEARGAALRASVMDLIQVTSGRMSEWDEATRIYASSWRVRRLHLCLSSQFTVVHFNFHPGSEIDNDNNDLYERAFYLLLSCAHSSYFYHLWLLQTSPNGSHDLNWPTLSNLWWIDVLKASYLSFLLYSFHLPFVSVAHLRCEKKCGITHSWNEGVFPSGIASGHLFCGRVYAINILPAPFPSISGRGRLFRQLQ